MMEAVLVYGVLGMLAVLFLWKMFLLGRWILRGIRTIGALPDDDISHIIQLPYGEKARFWEHYGLPDAKVLLAMDRPPEDILVLIDEYIFFLLYQRIPAIPFEDLPQLYKVIFLSELFQRELANGGITQFWANTDHMYDAEILRVFALLGLETYVHWYEEALRVEHTSSVLEAIEECFSTEEGALSDAAFSYLESHQKELREIEFTVERIDKNREV